MRLIPSLNKSHATYSELTGSRGGGKRRRQEEEEKARGGEGGGGKMQEEEEGRRRSRGPPSCPPAATRPKWFKNRIFTKGSFAFREEEHYLAYCTVSEVLTLPPGIPNITLRPSP